MYINSLTFPVNINCDSLHYYFDTMIFSKNHESAISWQLTNVRPEKLAAWQYSHMNTVKLAAWPYGSMNW